MIDELLHPTTDAGAGVQFAVAVIATLMFGFALRRHREWQLLAGGLGICVVGLIALRAVH